MRIFQVNVWRAFVYMFFIALNAGCSVFGIYDYETPKYEVILKAGRNEIRYYQSYIVAKTTAKGDFGEAQRATFKILADYIFGANEKKQNISMTAPVVQKPYVESVKLSMTAPVVQQPEGQGWVMTFMMPSTYEMADLPTPKDPRITFEAIPERYVAAVRYSWFGNKNRNDRKARELLQWIAELKEYEPLSSPMYAGYDPPWTVPFVRRNEMMVVIKRKLEKY